MKEIKVWFNGEKITNWFLKNGIYTIDRYYDDGFILHTPNVNGIKPNKYWSLS